MPFLTHRVVVRFAAVIDQLQAPWVGVSSSRIAIDTQVIFEFYLTQGHTVIQ